MEINSWNAEMAWRDILMRTDGWVYQESRNGPVKTHPGPLTLTVLHPRERVLFNPVRNCNPFFHLVECAWMLGGRSDVRPLIPFNKRMAEFAEDNGMIHGAYGFRWAGHFGPNQLISAYTTLKNYPDSRHAVIAMWDPQSDNEQGLRDRPCNIAITFRIIDNRLHMFVFNRSNDIMWGMLGANVVHMTVLQEVMAARLGVGMGHYTVMTSNAHFYVEKHDLKAQRDAALTYYDRYGDPNVSYYDIKFPDMSFWDIRSACSAALETRKAPEGTWLADVVCPAMEAYLDRSNGCLDKVQLIKAPDWRIACHEWLLRNRLKDRTTKEPSSNTGNSPS